ncbi:hypothetical protein BV20DRAFT_1025472 [Pilatotrama ljubarskyi]|nr:hypothetical protein BV20DRAFT_1025472 [Pilatotrama ljubarskyi]
MPVSSDVPSQCVYNVPMALNEDLTRTDGLEPKLARARNAQHVLNSREFTYGPMPIIGFLNVFLPYPPDDAKGRLSSTRAFSAVLQSARTTAEISEPLLHALNKKTKHKSRCPGFFFEDTCRRILPPVQIGHAMPHICCFARRNLQAVRQASRRSRAELGYAEFFIQFLENDFYVDPPKDANPESVASHDFVARWDTAAAQAENDRVLGLHLAFATEIFARQHRCFLFSISIVGTSARLFRWDRAGCVVSEAFDIGDHPEYLCEFLWRFAQTTDDARGHDPTVEPAMPAEHALFRDTIREHVRSQLDVEGDQLALALTQHYLPEHVTAIYVYPSNAPTLGDNAVRYIVSRPIVSPLSLAGRGTRGYWAVDARTRSVVFLKDTWRPYSRSHVEGEILKHLVDLGVRNVPALVTHGGVPCERPDQVRRLDAPYLQATLTHRVRSEEWVCRVCGDLPQVSLLQHYRVVMATVGYSLRTLRGTEELLHATYDVFTAMRDALVKASRIHRDISVGNIILVKEPGRSIRRGYLIDWEASDILNDDGESSRPGRAGTWHFMSIRMLDGTTTKVRQKFQDDMESLFYVVLYCALLYLPHGLSGEALTMLIRGYFEDSIELTISGVRVQHGGTKKILNTFNRFVLKRAEFKSAALVEWLNAVMDFSSPLGDLQRRYPDMWSDPSKFDAFWSDFLATHTLERDDRVVHRLDMSAYYDSGARSEIPSLTASPQPRKRSPADESEPAELGAARKRTRTRAGSAQAIPRGAAHGEDGSVVELRRSQRIKERSSRPKAGPGTARLGGITANAVGRSAPGLPKGRQPARPRK